MSIYATFWALQFPSEGNYHTGCSWTEVVAQSVPAHVGADGPDLYASFLPPIATSIKNQTRAVVFVRSGSAKGTSRSPQEYASPLLVVSGREYYSMSFDAVHEAICNALRGDKQRFILETHSAKGVDVVFEDGSCKSMPVPPNNPLDRSRP
jgi:hypothetical protein